MLDFSYDTSLLPPVHPKPTLPRKKLLKSLGNDDYLLEIDNTSLESFLACDRASFYRLILGRTSYPTAALTYGQAVHKALEVFYTTGPDVSEMFRQGNEILTAHPVSDAEWRNSDALYKTIQAYVKEYQRERFVVLSDDSGQPYVERAFSFHLGELRVDKTLDFTSQDLVIDNLDSSPLYIRTLQITWTGVIDLLIEQNDEVWITDHKTASMIGDSYFKGFELGQQFVGYVWSASRILNRPISGALLNLIGGRKPTKTGVSLELLRRFYPYSSWLTDEWQDDILALVSDFVHRLTSNFFPKRTLWCVNKWGTCQYISVCSSLPEHRPILLASDQFTDLTWNPLDKQ